MRRREKERKDVPHRFHSLYTATEMIVFNITCSMGKPEEESLHDFRKTTTNSNRPVEILSKKDAYMQASLVSNTRRETSRENGIEKGRPTSGVNLSV